MWRTLCLLSLTLFTFDFLRISFARGETVRANGEPIAREEDPRIHRKETRAQLEVKVDPRRFHEDEDTSELVGKWRNNGEALEPKWRDGDTVPLLPFPRLSRYPEDKIIISDEEEDYIRRRPKYRQNNEQENSLRSKNNGPPFHEYEDYDRRGYRDRKRTNRPWTKGTSTRNEEQTLETVENRESISTRYREIFEARPNDYEQELNDEEYLKPRPRKRKPPQNYEFALVKNETLEEPIGITPRPQPRANLQKPSSSMSKPGQLLQNAMELKSLLKMQQEEGLSLSELLQQRNLTLNDLLKGRADAIDALKMRDAGENGDYVKEATRMVSNSFLRLPIAVKPQWPVVKAPAKSMTSQKEDKLVVSIIATPLLEDPKGYLSSAANRSEAYANIGGSTTRKTILATLEPPKSRVTTSMPSSVATSSMELLHSAMKSQNNGEIKVNNTEEDEIMEFSDFTDYKKGRNGVSPVWLMMKNEDTDGPQSKSNLEDKGSTLSIEKILGSTERSKLTNDSMDMDETVDYDTSPDREYQNDAPLMYHDLEHATQVNSFNEDGGTTKMEPISSTPEDTLRNHQGTNTTEKTFVSEAEPDARAEIFELFASGSAGKRLERLLKSRNMSLEELIALRQRGSSRVHLAEVSRIKVQKLNEEDKDTFKTITSTPSVDQSTTYDERIHDSSTRSPQNSTTYESMSNAIQSVTEETLLSSEPTVKEEKPLDTSPHRKSQIVDLLTTFGSMQFVKDIQRNFVGDKETKRLPVDQNDQSIVFVNNDTELIRFNDTSTVVQSGYVKEVIEEKPGSIDVHTTFEEVDREEETINKKRKTLSNVKPSIIASGAILGVTIVVFLAIFIVCRIRQKQKYRYRNTFSRAVFQGPVMAARKLSNSSSLSTVMVNVVATSTTKRPEKNEIQEPVPEMDFKSDIDNDSLDANDSWETIPDYMK